jgi:FtsJ-like methyltransferase
LQGSLRDVVVPAIYRSIVDNLLRMDTHCGGLEFGNTDDAASCVAASSEKAPKGLDKSNRNMVSIRLAVFPPNLQSPLLAELERQWGSTFLPMVSEYEQARTTVGSDRINASTTTRGGIPVVQFSPTHATHTLGIVMVHEGVVDDATTTAGLDERSTTGALYALGRLEQLVTVHDTKDTDDCHPTSLIGASINNKPVSSTLTNNNYNRNDNAKNATTESISRAYYKLQEAWERYMYHPPTRGLRSLSRPSLSGSNGDAITSGGGAVRALDCGSAPGGWTKFLYDRYNCKSIYSVDPGQLAPQILDLDPSVIRHMPCTIQQAFPQLIKERDDPRFWQQDGSEICADPKDDCIGRPFLDIWVSDMCVKDMPAQVDLFLEALRLDLVGPGTFFVLTMKCVLGHSHATFDHLVKVQVDRLTTGHPVAAVASNADGKQLARSTTNERISEGGTQPRCWGVQALHLFANRSSERTILGYLC